MPPRLLLIVPLLAVLGCGGRTGPQGPLDSRLYGVWESRRGFVGTDTIDFHKDGTMKVTADDGQKKKSYTAQWYVTEQGKEQIKVNMQAQGKEEFRVRRIKFHEDGTFEMTEGSKILGRFEKKKKA
jgi:hypothetical protein